MTLRLLCTVRVFSNGESNVFGIFRLAQTKGKFNVTTATCCSIKVTIMRWSGAKLLSLEVLTRSQTSSPAAQQKRRMVDSFQPSLRSQGLSGLWLCLRACMIEAGHQPSHFIWAYKNTRFIHDFLHSSVSIPLTASQRPSHL